MKRKALVLGLVLGLSTLRANGGTPRDYRRKEADQWLSCIRTLMDMKAVQTAVEAYAVDHGAYPRASTLEGLRDLVQPAYIANVPLKDAWGTPFRYVVAPDGKTYLLVSAGSDRAFTEASWKVPAFLSDSEADAVLSSEGWGTYREWVIQE